MSQVTGERYSQSAPPPPPPSNERVTLVMPLECARTLRTLFRHVGGGMENSRRAHIAELSNVLDGMGVSAVLDAVAPEGHITFRSGK